MGEMIFRRSASARVAMIGAGQLARMTHQAAIDLDVDLGVLADSPDDSAVLAGAPWRLGSPNTLADIEAMAANADVVTFDHELIPGEHLAKLEALGHRLNPSPAALALAQDKLKARRVLSARGFPLPEFSPVSSPGEVSEFAEVHGWPVVVKSPSGGYDGRGVHVIENHAQAAALLGGHPAADATWLAEQHVELAAELAILVARTPSGKTAVYPAVQTFQRDGICRYLQIPAELPSATLDEATNVAMSIAEEIGATGILAVEMFVDASGRLLVNELALRPHNSGHITIEACETSQFHQHLRAILDWPLGPTTMRGPAATVNLIGESTGADPSQRLPEALAIPGVHVHLYGKAFRAGRKLGHVTALGRTPGEALGLAQAAAGLLTGS